MQPYAEMSTEELHALKKQLSVRYRDFQGKDLRLDMSRGKPSVDQLDLSRSRRIISLSLGTPV